VEAGRVWVRVAVDAGKVARYELMMVDAGCIEVSTRVRVCWGSVDMMVL
jgi:hypothetical protein